jgi:hypothetical protein
MKRGTARNSEVPKDITRMIANREFASAEALRDGFGGQPLAQQLEDFLLHRRHTGSFGRRPVS